jgi:hypothetical protein
MAAVRRGAVVTTMAAPPRATGTGYLSLTTLAGGHSSPILFGSNPFGDVLLSSGVMTYAGPSAASMVPVLPVRVSGIEVSEVLHRLDADAREPTVERGIAAANRIGEPLGVLTMRWLLAPDAFEATPSSVPPATELDPSRSQRFVMLDGVFRFRDRTASGARFFGAGRTYPLAGDGATRLMFAGAAVIVEGLGSLKGLRGSLTVAGEIRSRSLASLGVIGRFDGDGPFEAAEQVGRLIDAAGGAPNATVLTLASEPVDGAPMGVVEERLRAARIENDLANSSRPRSAFQAGAIVGRATGPLHFDPAERRCAVPLVDARRELRFVDAAGRPIGAILVDRLEGTAFRDARAGDRTSRVIAYGPVSAGAGALAGASGLLTMDTEVSAGGAAAGVYTLWLLDERGRFRAPAAAPAAADPASPLSGSAFRFADASIASMLPEDLAILAHAERTLLDGGDLYQWLDRQDRAGDYAERFDLARERVSGDERFGFFDVATVAGRQVPVMGVVEDLFYDRDERGTSETIRGQLREFVLRYFLRIYHGREDHTTAPGRRPAASAFERALSRSPEDVQEIGGSGYEQRYYKRADSGEIGKFARDERRAIVDLRELGAVYDWILLKVDALTFDVSLAPFGSAAPKLQVPVHQDGAYVIVGPAFLTDVAHPESGAIAEYGFGYAFLPYAPGRPGLVAFAPGHYRAAVHAVTFRLMASGEIRARTRFVLTRPDQIVAVDVDPIGWGMQMADMLTFRIASQLMRPMLAVTDRLPLRARGVDPVGASVWMANLMTGGFAARRFGLSKESLEKRMLLQHLVQHDDMMMHSALVWRLVDDWTDRVPQPGDRGDVRA